MYLEVQPNGARYWRLRYRHTGKEKLLALGVYPIVSLKDAREEKDAAKKKKKKFANSVDPSETRKAEKRSTATNAENSSEAVAREWHAQFTANQSASHAARNLRRLEVHVFSYTGAAPSCQSNHLTYSTCCNVSKKGQSNRAPGAMAGRANHSVRHLNRPPATRCCGRLTRRDPASAGKTSCCGYNASGDSRTAARMLRLHRHCGRDGSTQVSASGVPAAGRETLGRMDGIRFQGKNVDDSLARMKRRKEGKINGTLHLVPLSRQAIDILQNVQLLTGRGKYVFPSARGNKRPMSDMALSAVFKRRGIDAETALPHGWRATSRTVPVEELSVPAEVIEMQLAHEVKDSLGRAYNCTQWIKERRDLMQRWADYLDGLRTSQRM